MSITEKLKQIQGVFNWKKDNPELGKVPGGIEETMLDRIISIIASNSSDREEIIKELLKIDDEEKLLDIKDYIKKK